jgi:TDG/mug DNA glycosylase family protein
MMSMLPDIIDYNLKILFIGFNPGLRSAETGHHYAGISNNFWKLLFESGLTPYRLKPEEDHTLLKMGYGSTNIVSRPTRSASEISSAEFKAGAGRINDILLEYRPGIACYMGIGVYRALTGKKDIGCGLQKDCIVKGTRDYVCTSPSGLNRLPYKEQLRCFRGLVQLIDP